MAQTKSIAELMAVAPADHDLNWLKDALQAAIQLEFATIPPYLCAYWSIKNSLDDDAQSIFTVVIEEMAHMAIACNLLTAIGGMPAINAPAFLPTYPGELPGGVHADLRVSLEALSKEAAYTFMQIELPQNGPLAAAVVGPFATIGDFYQAVQDAFDTLQPALSATHQVAGPLGVGTITTLDQVRQGIGLIRHQGEGSDTSPEEAPGDLAHYYRFGEIFHQRALKQDPATGKWDFTGDPRPMPDIWPMAVVPPGGYQQADVEPGSPRAWNLIQSFDSTFTEMLNLLQSAWATGDSRQVRAATRKMTDLTDTAVELIQIPRSDGAGNYGPCFRIVR